MKKDNKTNDKMEPEPRSMKEIIEKFGWSRNVNLDAFDALKYDIEDEGDGLKSELPKMILIVSFVIDCLTECGNKDLDGMIAQGLSLTLKRCARECEKKNQILVQTNDDLRLMVEAFKKEGGFGRAKSAVA